MPKLSHSGNTIPCGTIVKTMDYEVQLKRIKNVFVSTMKLTNQKTFERLSFTQDGGLLCQHADKRSFSMQTL